MGKGGEEGKEKRRKRGGKKRGRARSVWMLSDF